jgi:hypothetical protein
VRGCFESLVERLDHRSNSYEVIGTKGYAVGFPRWPGPSTLDRLKLTGDDKVGFFFLLTEVLASFKANDSDDLIDLIMQAPL